VQVESGTVLVRGCEFRANRPQIQLSEAVDRAVITDNVFTGPAQITSLSSCCVEMETAISLASSCALSRNIASMLASPAKSPFASLGILPIFPV
jgi:hypothetical protein